MEGVKIYGGAENLDRKDRLDNILQNMERKDKSAKIIGENEREEVRVREHD